MGGGSKKQTVGYKYYLGEHMVLCHGPIDNLSEIYVDEKELWLGEQTANGQLSINKEKLFGGESREGGISGNLDVMLGGPTQGKNSYLQAQLGNDIPGYRGVVGVVLRKMYLGVNPYLKPWAFRAQRIHKTGIDGDIQWYDAKAEIAPTLVGREDVWKYREAAPGSTADYSSPSYDDSGWTEGQGGFGNYAPGFNTPAANTIIFGGAVPTTSGNIIWIRRTVSGLAAKTMVLDAWHDDGAEIWVNGNKLTLSYINYFQSRTRVPASYLNVDSDNVVVMKVTDSQPSGNATYIYAGCQIQAVPDMNPAHIIRECLTDPDWGMGYTAADIDDTSFMAAADTLHDEELGMSLLWDRQMQLEDFIKEIVRHIDAALYVSRTSGKFVLKLIRDDYDPDSLITLDESNIAKITNPSKPTFGELSNQVTVAFWNGDTGKDASVTVTDTAMVQQQGQVIGTTVQYPGFTTVRNATIAAQRDLRSLSSSFLSCTIYCDQTAKDLNIGDTFKFTWGPWYVQDMVMRVTGIAFGDGKTNQVRVTCAQDVFSTPLVPVVTPSSAQWIDPAQPPSPVVYQMATEIPYYELVINLGQTTIDNTLTANPEVGYAMAAAAKNGVAVNARVWSDPGTGYEDVGALDFCPFMQLDEDITPTQTVFYYTGGVSLDDIEVGQHVQIGTGNDDMELCRVDAVNTTLSRITVGRGVLDTTPKAHASGTPMFFWDIYYGYDPTEYVLSEVIDLKVTPSSGTGEVDISNATEVSMTMAQRAYRPYPPGQFQINSQYYPDGLDGLLTITWADRDRAQQTDGTLYDHTAADIGPEAGTTYRVRCYLDDVLDTTIEPATSGETWMPPGEGVARIEVDSKRDGVYSLQTAKHEFAYTGSDIRGLEGSPLDRRADEDNEQRATED